MWVTVIKCLNSGFAVVTTIKNVSMFGKNFSHPDKKKNQIQVIMAQSKVNRPEEKSMCVKGNKDPALRSCCVLTCVHMPNLKGSATRLDLHGK